MKYVDACKTLEILKMDSGLLPKPNPKWNTFTPKVDDLALVGNKEYKFNGNDWEVVENE